MSASSCEVSPLTGQLSYEGRVETPGKLLFLESNACRKIAFSFLQALFCIFIDDVVFDDETEVLDVDEDLDDLSVDIQDTQSAQPAKQGRGQVVNSDDDVSLDDVDLFDDTTVSRTEERPQNVKTSGKTMGSQKQPQTTQNNSDIDYMSLNDISIFDSEE